MVPSNSLINREMGATFQDHEAASSTASTGRLWRALGVFPEERPKVLWTGALFFVVIASASIGLNTADALFFVRFGVDSLPSMIMLSGLVVMAVTIGHSAGLARFGARIWTWATAFGFAGLLIAERLAIGADLPAIYPVVWLTGQVVIYVGFTLLWDVAGELADTRQAKRLFPLFMSAGIAGAVTGNALTGPLARLLGTENLLVVEAAAFALAGLIGKVTTQHFVRRKTGPAASVIRELGNGMRTTFRVPLFRLVAGIGAALSVLFFLVFFPFSEVAAASFETEEALAAFLGVFSSVATAVTFLVSLLVANRLFTRFGVVVVLLIVALVYVAGFSLWLVSFGLFTVTLFRGVQWVAVNALGTTAFTSLFNVLTGDARAQTRDFVTAVPVQAGTIVGGALLLAGSSLSGMSRTIISLGVAVAFLLLVLPMRRAYSAALVDAVRHGLSAVFTPSMPGMQKPHHDADSLGALVSTIGDASPGRRRVSAAILGEVGGSAAIDALRGLLRDADETVRLQAIASLAQADGPSLTAHAIGLLDDPAVRVRRRAVASLGRDQATDPAVRRALEDPDTEVRAHAARIVGGHTGRKIIDEMMDGDDPHAIAAAMRCVVAEPELASIDARRYVDHSDPQVRAVAAEMLATRRDSVATLRRMVDDPSSDVRLAAARSLVVVDHTAVHDILEHGSVRARETALEAVVATDVGDEYLSTWAASELDRAAELHRFRMAIESRFDGASIAAEYLARVLGKREGMVERWVVMALGTDDTRAALPLVARGAISGEADVKAEALEAIESIADRTLARRLVALLEGRADGGAPYRLHALQQLASDHQAWFRALALRTMYEEFNRDLEAASATAATDESPVVRQAMPELARIPTDDAAGLTVVDAVLALQEAPIFENLDPEELEALAMRSEERRYAPGETVYAKGSVGDELMVVIAGQAIVRVTGTDGSRIIATRGPGEPMGELGVLRRQPRMADVVAGPDGLHGLTIGAHDFMHVLEEQPSMATALLATLAERIARTVDLSAAGRHTLVG